MQGHHIIPRSLFNDDMVHVPMEILIRPLPYQIPAEGKRRVLPF
jgi:hypothetical protein